VIREAIAKLVEQKGLNEEEAATVAKEILSGVATPAQIAAYLTALRMKGENVEELVGMAKTMREYCNKINPKIPSKRLIDTCGTGGDGGGTFNASTAAAIIASGAGAYVAKHGNRSVSSRSGSADVLEMLGVNIYAPPEAVERCIERIGIGFMFAPIFHPAMKKAAEPRRELGIRTIFNVLGPLTNPAFVNGQLVGVYSEEVVPLVAHALKRLGVERALVVHGSGLDEISVSGPTNIADVSKDGVSFYTLTPAELGIKPTRINDLKVSSPADSAAKLFQLLYSPEKAAQGLLEFALVNSAAALTVAEIADNILEGMELARESLHTGKAYERLKLLIRESGGNLAKLEEMEEKYG